MIGLSAVILGILGAAFVLVPGGLGQQTTPPTIEVIIQDPGAGVIVIQTPLGDMAQGGPTLMPTDTQAAPTPTSAPTPTPVPPVEYTVQAGDTCGAIAQRNGVTLEELTAANDLDTVNCLIRVGDTLIIPVPTPTPDPAATSAPTAATGPTSTVPPEIVYVVRGGDTCSEIAQQFNVTVDLLITQNNLDANCLIQLNQVLTITFATPTPVATVTPFILQTPTPRAGYSAPVVLAPQEDAQIGESQDVVTLQWLTVGLLKPEEWYVVQVQPTGAITVPLFETKATSLKLTQDILGGQVEREIAWWVQVRRRDGGVPAGPGAYVDVSPPSAVRRFIWRRPISPATPVATE
jgi:LysM repeat protein